MEARIRNRIVRHTAGITLACMAGSVLIAQAITYLATGSMDRGVGLLISMLAPVLIVPVGSYAHVSLAARLRDANDKLRALSETDPLTHICNRRRFLEVAEQQLALARRHGYPTSILLIDFDHFKQVNDGYGHVTGDRVLVEGAAAIAGTLRETDTLARFGGEEFIVLLPHTARAGAEMLAERILVAMRAFALEHDGATIRVSVSVGGVTCAASETSLERMTSRADSLLYASKQAGRNCCLVEDLPAPAVSAAGGCSAA